MNIFTKLTEKQKRRIEIIIAVIMLFVMFEMRAYKLDADPPIGLSFSTDVYTDSNHYTLFAKQKVLTDDFNPYDETRFVFFLKSSVTLLAFFVFSLFGVTLEMSNLVGLFYSFGSLLLFYMILRKISNPITGIIYLLLIAVNYNQIFYGRLAFLEHAMSFYAFLSLTLLLYCTRTFWILFAGAFLAVGIFFGKIIGVIFVVPFAGFFLYQHFVEEKETKLPLIYFSSGFIAMTLFWLFFSYLPMQKQVASYVGEHAFSLYGNLAAFESFDNFVWKYFSFGKESKLFARMRVPLLFASIFLSMFAISFFNRGTLKEKLKNYNSGKFFIFLMIVSFYGGLMIWNNRPLRYQLELIYPFYAAASIILGSMFYKLKKHESNKIPLFSLLIIFVIFLPVIYQYYNMYVGLIGGSFFYDDYKFITVGWTFFFSLAVYALMISYQKYNEQLQAKVFRYVRIGFAVAIVAVVFTSNILDFLYWAERPTFTGRDNSLDLGELLAEGAVVSGPYAGLLTAENKVGTVIHMFGVTKADPDFFKNQPITHLLLDSGNETRAKEDYPILMDSSELLFTYHVGQQKVRLYRIAGFTGNDIADSYQLSPFEHVVSVYDNGKGQINNDLVVELIEKNPDNIACYTFLAEAAEQDSIFQLSEMMFKKAVEFSPTNYNLNARLAKFYQDRYNETNIELYKAESKNYYEEAIKFSPTTSRLKRELIELEQS